METLAVELLEEIGLYLDPKSYHSLRKSFNTLLPFVQRVLPCYFDHPRVQGLLEELPKKDMNAYCKITQMNQTLYWKLLDIHQYNLLVPFAQQILESHQQFYHINNLKNAIKHGQSVYIASLFQNSTFLADVTNITELYPIIHVEICQVTN